MDPTFVVSMVLCLATVILFMLLGGRIARRICRDEGGQKGLVTLQLLLLLLPILFAWIVDWIDLSELISETPVSKHLIADLDRLAAMQPQAGSPPIDPEHRLLVQSIRSRYVDLSARQTGTAPVMLAGILLGWIIGLPLLSWRCARESKAVLAEARRAHQRSLQTGRLALDSTRAQIGAHRQVMVGVGSIVGAKRARLARALSGNIKKGDCQLCREVLNPDEQIDHIVAAVHTLFRDRLSRHPNTTCRAALYTVEKKEKEENRDGTYLKVLQSTDGSIWDVITSPNAKHKESFRVDAPPTTMVCRAFRGSPPIDIIADTTEYVGRSDDRFRFLDDSQRETIRSIFVCQLKGAYEDATAIGALAVDSNQPGFFTEDDRLLIALLAHQVSMRLDFELQMRELLIRVGEGQEGVPNGE